MVAASVKDDAYNILPQGWTARDALVAAAITGAVITAAVILAPHVIPAIGLDPTGIATTVMSPLHHYPSGLAMGISKALSYVPLIGEQLAAGGMFSAVASGVAGLGGVFIGHCMSKYCDGKKESIDWGGIIKWAGLATSALIAMPALLTGLSHGIAFIAQVIDPGLGRLALNLVAKTTGVLSAVSSASSGIAGATATLPHMLACGISFAPVIAGFGADKELTHVERLSHGRVKKILPPNDPNHFVSPQEQALVEAYNQASPQQKPIMQKWFRAQGYDPDFSHADGSMHLHKHPHKDVGSPSLS